MAKEVVSFMFLGLLCFLKGADSQVGSCPSVNGFTASAISEGTLEASWEPNASHTGFMLEYSPSSHVTPQQQQLEGSARQRILTGLLNFTHYDLMLTPMCGSSNGQPSTAEATTIEAVPSARVANFMTNENDFPVVHFKWPPIPESSWNGIPGGYFVYIFHESDLEEARHTVRVNYPSTSLAIFLQQGRYGLHIGAFNAKGTGEFLESDLFVIGESASQPSFVEYPYFYILIPGVIFLVFTVVIIIVIFKKLRERNKRSISFARGIDPDNATYSKGFGNALPMREFSPHSPNTSASIPLSSTLTSPVFQQQHNHHQQLANRPLPLSPDPAFQPVDDPPFAPTLSGHPSMNRKLTHPGPLPMLEENVEQTGFVSIPRAVTDPNMGAVFSPVSINSAPPPSHQIQQPGQGQQQQQQQQRGRSNTLPSPYEVPDSNMPPHEMQAPQGRSGSVPQAVRGGIPPPPMHSPPPLTHSTSDLPHVFDNSHNSRHHHQQHLIQQQQQQQQHVSGQGSLPRTNQRSYSTSAAPGPGRTVVGGKGVPYMKSDGNIHDSGVEGGEPYYMPPGESDEEASATAAAVATAGAGAGRHQSLERGQRPAYPHQSRHKSRQQQSKNPGMLNGALATSDQLGGFGAAAGGEGPIPPSYPLSPAAGQGMGGRDKNRESLFSETSTEASVCSNSNEHIHHNDKQRRDSLFSESSGELSASNVRGGNPMGSLGGGGGGGGGGMSKSRNESVFSETSTELSISSNASKRTSPGWSGVKSDVGMSNRGQRSKSPPERETFSEVGAPRGGFIHPQQNGFV